MRILKNYWLRAGAVVLTLMLGVFVIVGAVEKNDTPVESKVLQSEPWEYTGIPGDSDQETDASFYNRPSGSLSCPSGSNICGVVAPEDPSNPGHPDLSDDLQSRILSRNTASSDVMLKN